MPMNDPKPSAKNDTGEFDRFDNLMKRVVTVSKTELQRRIDAERTAKTSVSRVPDASH